jgi:hypothetical protein
MPMTHSITRGPGRLASARVGARLLTVALAASLVLTGCSIGGDDDPEPTATVATTGAPAGAPATTGGTPAAGAGANAAAPEPRVVGDLVDRIALAWVGVSSYRTTTVQGTGDLSAIPLPGTPVAGAGAPPLDAPTTQAAIDEVVLPNQRRYLESSSGAVSEFLATGDTVFVRGRYAQVSIRPDLDATTWVNLDPRFISADSPVGQVLDQFAAPGTAAFRPPLADLQPDTRALELEAVGPVEVGGRACQAYRWTSTTPTGEAVTRTLSVDASGLPCALDFAAGDYGSRTTWDGFNGVAPITAPEVWVTVGETLDMGTGGTPAVDPPGAAQPPPATPIV